MKPTIVPVVLFACAALACGGSGKVGSSGAAGATGQAGASGGGGSTGAAGTSSGAAGESTGQAGVGAAGSTAGAPGAAGTSGGAGTGAGGDNGSAGTKGSAGTSGGAGMNGAGGAAGLGGTSKCAGSKYLLCESFEDTAVGAIPTGWTRQVTGNDNTLVAVDDKESARGSHALKMGAVANGPRRIVHPATTFGAAHWGRIFYKIQTPAPKISGYLHSTMVALVGNNPMGSGTQENRVVDTVEDPSGKNQFLYNVQPQGNEYGTGSPYDYMYDNAWHCAEWHVDAAAQSYHFYLDGNELTKIALMGDITKTGLPQMFQSIEVGWYNYQSAPPGFVAWIDEVAVDTARIGCGG